MKYFVGILVVAGGLVLWSVFHSDSEKDSVKTASETQTPMDSYLESEPQGSETLSEVTQEAGVSSEGSDQKPELKNYKKNEGDIAFENKVIELIGDEGLARDILLAVKQRVYKQNKWTDDSEESINCKSQEECPHKLDIFYGEALSKLPSEEMPRFKNHIMAEMMESELDQEYKKEFLTNQLLSAEPSPEQVRAASSQSTDTHPYQLLGMYKLIAAQNLLFVDEQGQSIGTITQVAKQTQDQELKMQLSGLVYQKLKQGDDPQAAQQALLDIGFSPEQIQQLTQPSNDPNAE